MNDLVKMKRDEWLETDGLGGFSSGTVSGIRTRRYHALLLAATRPPAGRVVLVNGFDAWVETANGTYALSSQIYPPDVLYPDGARRIVDFKHDPWPQWTYVLEDGTTLRQELFAVHGAPIVCLSWRLTAPSHAVLTLRPLISGRDYHSMHHENLAFRFEAQIRGQRVLWHPYPDIPSVLALSNGAYHHQPDWYRHFAYEEERNRGLDFTEDLASPGAFRWNLNQNEAVLILAAEEFAGDRITSDQPPEQLMPELRAAEQIRRAEFSTPLDRAADAYLVSRGKGKTIVAGYPWFTDWGRDTFISLRGLCLATKRFEEARDILVEWAGVVSEGMLPNLFPDQSDSPEYNSVDASLWYIIAVHELLEATKGRKGIVSRWQKKTLQEAVDAILIGFSQGTRYGIHMDHDGLLAAGVPGVQLTWMDAKVGDWVVTPRVGKPVEVQALWLNALWIGSQFSARWKELLAPGLRNFRERFWNDPGGYLYDVVDVDHEPGKLDDTFRPNQIFAVGGLPMALLEGERAKAIVSAVEQCLWTPIGLRSLAPEAPAYARRYEGGVRERDGAYHQGTVWPWLIGPFVEGWVRVRGNDDKAKRDAHERFLAPLSVHLNDAGLGHVSEIADAEPPFTPRGCPFQAWSLAELLRLDRVILHVSMIPQTLHRMAAP